MNSVEVVTVIPWRFMYQAVFKRKEVALLAHYLLVAERCGWITGYAEVTWEAIPTSELPTTRPATHHWFPRTRFLDPLELPNFRVGDDTASHNELRLGLE
jgi:hypothetical protein